MDSKEILTELKELKKPMLSDKEQELKKAFAKDFLGIRSNVNRDFLDRDYERISKIKENYPVSAFMNLFANHDTKEVIDLDKLFGL